MIFFRPGGIAVDASFQTRRKSLLCQQQTRGCSVGGFLPFFSHFSIHTESMMTPTHPNSSQSNFRAGKKRGGFVLGNKRRDEPSDQHFGFNKGGCVERGLSVGLSPGVATQIGIFRSVTRPLIINPY